MTEVREGTAADLDGIANALVSAFHDDPVMLHMFRKPSSRARKSRALFVSESKRAMKLGALHTTAGNDSPKGAAIWMGPGKWKASGLELLGQFPLMLKMGLEGGRAVSLLSKMEKVHPEEPHWYLAILGTATEHQGKGIGGKLLAPILETCDQEGIPAYLESSKDQNIPFYNRYGFEVTSEISIKDGPTLWPMWREPSPPEA